MTIPFEFSYVRRNSGVFFYILHKGIQTPEDLVQSKLFKHLGNLKTSKLNSKHEEESSELFIHISSPNTKIENIDFFSMEDVLVKKDSEDNCYLIFFPVTNLSSHLKVELASKELFLNDKEEVK